MLGTALRELAEKTGTEMVCPPHSEVDLMVPDQLRQAVDRHRPDVIINCVAMVGIVPCEKDPARAFGMHATAVLDLACL